MTRRRGHERVLSTIQQAVDLGYDPVKVSFYAFAACDQLSPFFVCRGGCSSVYMTATPTPPSLNECHLFIPSL